MSRNRKLIAVVVVAHIGVLLVAGIMGGCAGDKKKVPLAKVRPVEDIYAPEGEPESILEPVGMIEETELLVAREPGVIPSPIPPEPVDILSATARTEPEAAKPPVIPRLRPSGGPGEISSTRTHRVAAGDSLWKIGVAYGVTVGEIAEVNDLDKEAILRVGQVLLIPGEGAAVAVESAVEEKTVVESPSGEEEEGAPKKHVIRKGESLWSIAKKYGVPWKIIAEANGIEDASRVRTGQVIVIPE